MAAIARDGGEPGVAPIVFEVEGIHVIVDAGAKVRYGKDRLRAA
jgi:hypothetical protein